MLAHVRTLLGFRPVSVRTSPTLRTMAAAAVVPVLAALANAQPATFDLRSTSFFVVNGGGASYQPPLSNVVSFSIPDGIRLFPMLGTLLGHPLAPNGYAFMSQTGLNASGAVVGPIVVGSRLHVEYSLNFEFSGGRVEVSTLAADAYRPPALAYGFVRGLPVSVSSGVPFAGSFDTDVILSSGTNEHWNINLVFAWLDYTESDTFRLDTPGSRIDVELVAPPPAVACCRGASCSLMGAGECASAGGRFQVTTTTCGPAGNPTACCRANFNGVSGVTLQDLFDFLIAYFGQDPRADFNASDTISAQDIFDFLAAYFTGCS